MLNQEQNEVDENEAHQIMRGGQNITDGDAEELDSQMAKQLRQLDDDEGIGEDQGEDEDDDNQLIDIDKLNDEEKAILIQCLQT